MYESITYARVINTSLMAPTPVAAGGGDDAATTAWVAAVVGNGGMVSDARKTVVNVLIVGLKADGLFTKLDRLWLFAAENEGSALTDLVNGSLATTNGFPTFTADDGYTGEDSITPTKYINLSYNPSTDAVNYTLNAGHISGWSMTNVVATDPAVIVGTGASPNEVAIYHGGSGSSDMFFRVNDNSPTAYSPPDLTGHFIANRTTAALSQGYRNGSLVASPNRAVGTIATGNLDALRAGSSFFGDPNTITMVSIGGSLDGTDASNFYTHLRVYMTACGVP